MGLAAKLSGIKVIYDVHEDVPRHILQKYWMPNLLKRPLAYAMETLENFAAKCFDAIVTVTPHIESRFPRDKTVLVANFAMGKSIAPKTHTPEVQTNYIYLHRQYFRKTRSV